MGIRLFKLRCTGIMRDSGQILNQDDLDGHSTVKLVTSGAVAANSEVLLRGNLLFLNPDHAIELWLPTEARCAGVRLVIINVSTTSSIYVKDSSGEDVIVNLTDDCAVEVICSGSRWFHLSCAAATDGYGS